MQIRLLLITSIEHKPNSYDFLQFEWQNKILTVTIHAHPLLVPLNSVKPHLYKSTDRSRNQQRRPIDQCNKATSKLLPQKFDSFTILFQWNNRKEKNKPLQGTLQ